MEDNSSTESYNSINSIEYSDSNESDERIHININENINELFDTVQDEINLNNYTESHLGIIKMDDFARYSNSFIDISLNKSLHILENDRISLDNYFNNQSDMKLSPVSSLNGSDTELKNHSRYRKLTYKEVENEIEKYYNIDVENKYYNEIDILSTYVKGQKTLFIKSKNFTQFKLNLLMIISLILTSTVTVFTPFYCHYYWIEL